MKLKIGDKIRIIGIPGEGIPNYTLHRSTRAAYKALMARKRPVMISEIKDGTPWYSFRLKRKDGRWEHHSMSVHSDDNNWVKVKPREKNAG